MYTSKALEIVRLIFRMGAQWAWSHTYWQYSGRGHTLIGYTYNVFVDHKHDKCCYEEQGNDGQNAAILREEGGKEGILSMSRQHEVDMVGRPPSAKYYEIYSVPVG